jgi:hypothetical protein
MGDLTGLARGTQDVQAIAASFINSEEVQRLLRNYPFSALYIGSHNVAVLELLGMSWADIKQLWLIKEGDRLTTTRESAAITWPCSSCSA